MAQTFSNPPVLLRLCVIIPLTVSAFGQIATTAAPPSSVPKLVLYRMLCHHIGTLESSAASLDATNKAGASDLRNYYRDALHLTAAEAATLKVTAASCNIQLSQQDALARQAVTLARNLAGLPVLQSPGDATANASSISSSSTLTPAQAAMLPVVQSATPANAGSILTQLEQGRADISNGCILALQSSLSKRTFQNIDVYVQTVLATRASATQPPLIRPKAPLSGIPVNGVGK